MSFSLISSEQILKPINLGIFICIGIIGVYLFFGFQFLEKVSPYYGDELFYVKNAESFSLTGKLKATFTYSGNGSKLGELDAHGPAYPIVYGLLRLPLKWSPSNILWVNYGMLLISLFFLLRIKDNIQSKNLQSILILASPYTLFYSMSLMPELLQISFAILVFYHLKKVNKPTENQVGIISIILVAGLFRSTWFFGLIPLALFYFKSKKSLQLVLILLGITLPFLMQVYFHEAVPNVFSESLVLLKNGNWLKGSEGILYNIKRNIYFIFTYSEGWFYWVWKIGLGLTLIYGLTQWKRTPIIKWGTALFLLQLCFSIILYKTYAWTDLRLLSPISLILGLEYCSIFSESRKSLYPVVVTCIGFILIIPLQQKIIEYRISPSFNSIPTKIHWELSNLDHAIVRVDTTILHNFNLDQLPAVNKERKLIRYILPYYELQESTPTHYLILQDSQTVVLSTKILAQ